MKRKKDALLQQIAENNRESTVFFVTGYTDEQPTRFSAGGTEVLMYAETGSGFFVESDKIVTTIEVLAGADAVAAIPADRLAKAAFSRPRWFPKRNPPHITEEAAVSIEGVTAFDPKNNLVLLKIDETGVPLPLGNSDTVQIGEKVYTLGYRDDTEYEGIAGTLQSRYKDDKWLQIKTQFFLGCSGGPVLNSKNEVIGVVAYGTGSATGDSSATVATALSLNVLKELLTNSGEVMPLEQLQKRSRVHAYVLEAQADENVELYNNRAAIKNYNAALKLNPDLVEIYSKRGIVKVRIEDIPGAFRDFDKMIRINPEHIFSYNNRASAKATLGDEHGALDDLDKAIQINPEYIIAYMNRGGLKNHIAKIKMDQEDIVEAQRYYQEAIDDYTKVLALNPRNRLARKHRRITRCILQLSKFRHKTK